MYTLVLLVIALAPSIVTAQSVYRDMKHRNTVILLSNFTNDVAAIQEEIVKIIEQ